MKFPAIKEHHLYNKAYQKGSRASGANVTVYVLKDYAARRLMRAHPERQTVNRVGISVTKKVGGNSARFFVRQQKAVGKMEGFVEEIMNGQKVVQVFNHEEQTKTDFDALNEQQKCIRR